MEPDDGIRLIFVTMVGVIVADDRSAGHRPPPPGLGAGPTGDAFLVPALGLGTDTGVVSFGSSRSATSASWSPTG